MWQNKSIIESVDKLKSMNKIIINPESGYLASLHEGEGRLANINTITNEVRSVLEIKQPLKNKNILITAGPTLEPIDPVRFISNHSSGKMGYSIANAVCNKGANTTLISGPVNLGSPNEMTILELATKIISKINPELNIIYKAIPKDDPIRRKPDISLAKNKLSWSPEVTINNGLDKTIDFFRTSLK